MKTEHPSLTFPRETKPLIEKEELTEIARKAVLSEVDAEINRLVGTRETEQQILSMLQEIKDAVTAKDEQSEQLRLDVLRKLKAKLETG
jgi:hypothetical protein